MSKQQKDLVEKMKQTPARHGVSPGWMAILAREDPKFLAPYDAYRNNIYEKKALSPKVKELIIIAIDAAQWWPGIDVHMKRAFNIGVTKDEIVEALEVAALPGGIHALAYGLQALDRVLNSK